MSQLELEDEEKLTKKMRQMDIPSKGGSMFPSLKAHIVCIQFNMT